MSLQAYQAARYRRAFDFDPRLHPRDRAGRFSKKWGGTGFELPEIPEGVTIDSGDPQFAPVKWHLEGLAKVPKQTMEVLRERGVTWVVGDKGYADLDQNQDRAKEHPRGWGNKTWRQVKAGYDKRRRQVTLGMGLGAEGDPPEWTALHESGHAVDGLLGAFLKPEAVEAQQRLFERYKSLKRNLKHIVGEQKKIENSKDPADLKRWDELEVERVHAAKLLPRIPYYLQAPAYAPNQPAPSGREEMVASGLMYQWAGARDQGEEMFGKAFMDFIATLDGELAEKGDVSLRVPSFRGMGP